MNNDIVTKARLNAALGTEGNMGFEHNDIVTVDKMNEAIAEGGGGGGAYKSCSVTVVATNGTGFGLKCVYSDNGKSSGTFVDQEGFFEEIYAPGSESVTQTLLYIGDSTTLSPYTTVTNVEGDAEYDSDTGVVNVWGDCIITGWIND